MKSIKTANVKRYLIYAIGEILIVVIGIFIAIYFNKLREKKINRTYISEVLKDAKSEAEGYIKSAIYFIDYNAKRDSLAHKILKKNLSLKEYQLNGVKNLDVIQGLVEISFNPIHVTNLSNRIDYLNATEKKVYNQLLFIKKNQEGYASIPANAIEILNEYKKFRKTNHDWFYLIDYDSIAEKKELAYRLHSFEYKNFVSDFRKYEILHKTNYFSFFQCLSFRLLFKLINAKRSEKLTPKQIDSIFKKQNFNKLRKIECSTKPPKKSKEYNLFDNVYLYSYFYNSTKDTITIKKQKNLEKIATLVPNGYYINQFVNGTEFAVFVKDECKGKYKTQINSYFYYE